MFYSNQYGTFIIMGLVSSVCIAILTGYLAFTNTLAGYILTLLPSESPTIAAEATTPPPPDNSFFSLPSSLVPGKLAEALRNSADYQRASALDAAAPPPRPLTDPRHAVVNIACTFTSRDTIKSTTGTGFIVDGSGVVLTNAHVAQYLLLAETTALGEASCELKTGEPGTPQYRAELLYLPPAWIEGNAALITEKIPMGTGERDYALLHITQTTSGAPLPATFPALPLDTDLLPQGTQETEVFVLGYPAPDGLRPGDTLSIVTATTTISELYTFGSNYADVVSLRGSVVGGSGASGGPVLNAAGSVIGMIATRGDDSVDGVGSLRAITVSHIHRTISEETGFSLARNVSGDVVTRADVFKKTMAPFLLSQLTSELQ
jgi:S1-C subfamily serine protease